MMAENAVKIRAAALCMALFVFMTSCYAAPTDFFVDIDASHTEKAPRPQDDFYLSVNYEWIKDTPLAAGQASKNMFSSLEEKTGGILGRITTAATLEPKRNADFARIAALYACVNDDRGRERAGFGELAEIFAGIEACSTPQEYAETMGALMGEYQFADWFGGFAVERDRFDGSRCIPVWGVPQPGLGREFMSDSGNREKIELYRKYIKSLLVLYGRSEAEAEEAAEGILSIQRTMAELQEPLEKRNNPSGIERGNIDYLSSLYTNIDIRPVLEAAGIGEASGVAAFDIREPELICCADSFMEQGNLQVMKDYAIVRIIFVFDRELTPEIRDMADEFSAAVDETRRCLNPYERAEYSQRQTERLLPELYGRQYAALTYDEETKREILSFAEEMKEIYRKRIEAADWLSVPTKKYAKEKLDRLAVRIGAPEKWAEHADSFEIKRPAEGGVLIDNVLSLYRVRAAAHKDQLLRPFDASEWGFLPQTVNAFYRPCTNEIIIPSAMLQAPFSDKNGDRTDNLGGIGMILAHEISHSFDSIGAQFDADGVQRSWWTEEDQAAYKERIDSIAAFYGRYVAEDGMRTNGEQTLAENIADLGGISVVTEMVGDDKEALRRLYVKIAKCWRAKAGSSAWRRMAAGTHPFQYVRINGAMSSAEGFYRAFDVRPGDGMYVSPEERVGLW